MDRDKAIIWFNWMKKHHPTKLQHLIDKTYPINEWVERGFPMTGSMIEKLWKNR